MEHFSLPKFVRVPVPRAHVTNVIIIHRFLIFKFVLFCRLLDATAMSSSELMAHIRARSIGNVDLETSDNESQDYESESVVEATSTVTNETDELLVDLRNFIAFGKKNGGRRWRIMKLDYSRKKN